MKVLLVNHFPLEGSGSGVYTKNIAYRLRDHGHEVRVIVVDNERSSNYDFPVKTILYYDFPCFTTHPKSNNQFYNLSRREMNDYLKKFISAVNDEVRDFKPDLIHAQHLWVAPYAALLSKIPYIITAHGTDIKGYKKDKRYRHIALKAALKAEKIITISQQVHRDVMKYYYLPEEKLKLIMNGFDENIFKPMKIDRNKFLKKLLGDRFKEPNKVISFVGKLTNFKGVDLLIRAARIYEEEFPESVTLITGHGELRGELEEMVDNLGLKSVYFLGNRPQEVVAKIYNIADISVVPSRIEPFGLVAVESLACGTPVIASNAGGLPDFVDDSVGRLFPMDDYKHLAESIITALHEDDKQQKGEWAAEYALANFSWDRVIQDLLQIYNNIGNN
ncbi:MAG: glycosyltransferase [Halanaerobiaceae bacterium]